MDTRIDPRASRIARENPSEPTRPKPLADPLLPAVDADLHFRFSEPARPDEWRLLASEQRQMKPDMAMDDVERCGLSGDRVEQKNLSCGRGPIALRASRSARGQTGLSFALVVEVGAREQRVTSGAHHDLSTRPEGGCGWGVGCGACALAALVMSAKRIEIDDTCHGIVLWHSSGRGTWHSDRGSEMENGGRTLPWLEARICKLEQR